MQYEVIETVFVVAALDATEPSLAGCCDWLEYCVPCLHWTHRRITEPTSMCRTIDRAHSGTKIPYSSSCLMHRREVVHKVNATR